MFTILTERTKCDIKKENIAFQRKAWKENKGGSIRSESNFLWSARCGSANF